MGTSAQELTETHADVNGRPRCSGGGRQRSLLLSLVSGDGDTTPECEAWIDTGDHSFQIVEEPRRCALPDSPDNWSNRGQWPRG